MAEARCKHCGEYESEHCPGFAPRTVPPGCQCDPNEWDVDEIPPPCEEYVGDWTQNCKRCEHDEACHRKKED